MTRSTTAPTLPGTEIVLGEGITLRRSDIRLLRRIVATVSGLLDISVTAGGRLRVEWSGGVVEFTPMGRTYPDPSALFNEPLAEPSVTVDPRYLRDAGAGAFAAGASRLAVEIRGPLDPIILRAGPYTEIIMPIRTK